METITISKHKLVVGVSFLATFLIGMCLGIAIGVHGGDRGDRMYGGTMMRGEWGNDYQHKMIFMNQRMPAEKLETTVEATTTVTK